MERNSRWLLLASTIFIALLASGCTGDQLHDYFAHSDKITEGAGDAVAANRVVHTIDPWPSYSQKTQIDMDGKRALAAVRRYENSIAKRDGGAEPSAANGAANYGAANNGATAAKY
jgi:hypothetical protein